MQIAFVKPGRTVICGTTKGRFLRMSGSDALIELPNGKRVMWSGATEVDTLSEVVELTENVLPKLEAELARLNAFTRGEYAQLGVYIDTPCTTLPKILHDVFIRGALGNRPDGAIVCRRCTNELCVRADHLFWGTRSDCQRDMVLRGLAKPGGKLVSAVTIAAAIVKLRLRISRVKQNLNSVSDI